MSEAEKVTCPECKGTGGVYKAGDCSDCNGKGYGWDIIDDKSQSSAPIPEQAASIEGLPFWVMGNSPICFAPGIYYAESDVRALLATQSASVGIEGLTAEAFEEIAASWDGCHYEDAMIPDIGAALRADFKRLATQSAKQGAHPTGLSPMIKSALSVKAMIDESQAAPEQADVRDAVLEWAAQKFEEKRVGFLFDDSDLNRIAREIRSMKSKRAASTDKGADHE